jgi:hypothetical protein
MFYTDIRPISPALRRQRSATAAVATALARTMAAVMLRALVFLLVGLIMLFAGLMCLTGRYEVGILVLGGVLFIALGASNYAR